MNIFEILFEQYSLGFFIHLFVMMLIFVQSSPRRKNFWLRMVLGVSASLIACYIFPNDEYFVILKPFFLVTFFLVSFVIWVCFDIKYLHAVFYCTAMYAMQNLAYHVYAIISAVIGFDVFNPNLYIPLNYLMSFALCAAIYYLYLRKNKAAMETKLKNSRYLFITFIVLFVVFILNSVTGLSAWDAPGYIIINTTLATCCVLALLYQFGSLEQSELQLQKELMEQILHVEQQQHELSKETIEIINRKCHDLKHQIRLLRSAKDPASEEALKEIESAVMVYDAVTETENDALNIILTEKSLYCEQYHINLTCMVDGAALSFMSTADIYSLFGNIIDNAIESSMKIKAEEKRVIQLIASRHEQFLRIHAENYYEQAPVFKNGLPVTTKSDNNYHGYGAKSIQYIAEKYEGQARFEAKDHIFSLDIIMPIPSGK